jgi:uncharacterized protein
MIGMIVSPLQIRRSHCLVLPTTTCGRIRGNHRITAGSFLHVTGSHKVPFRLNAQYRLSSRTSAEQFPEQNEAASSENVLDNDTPHIDETVRKRTYQWLRHAVIGLNLCPFAREPTQSKQLRIVVRRGKDEERILDTVHKEMEALVKSSTTTALSKSEPTSPPITTTLVVCPECYPDDFEEYLNLSIALEEAIADHPDLVGVIQLASFHPLYCFAGSPDPTEPDNCTNQSPYPIFHLLREVDVNQAVEQLPDQNAAVVWSRNVDLLRALKEALPAAEFQATVSGTQSTSAQVRTILRRFPITLLRGSEGSDTATNGK